MILYDEKMDGDDNDSATANPPPTHRSLTSSPISSVNSRVGTGLLHQYLQIYQDSNPTTRLGPLRQNSDDTVLGQETPARSLPLDAPPPYDDIKEIIDEKSRLLSTFPSLLPPSPAPPVSRHSPSPQPVAGPSHSNRTRTGDIEGTWVLGSEADAASEEEQQHDGLSAVGCQHVDRRTFETLHGDIRGSVLFCGRNNRSKRFEIVAITHCGSIDLSLSPESDFPAARLRMKAASKAQGDVRIHLPANFTGVVRARSSSPRHQALQPNISQLPHPIDPSFAGPITLVSASRSEYFIGDVTREGYLKGMDDEDWEGNLIEVDAHEGSAALVVSPQPQTTSRAPWGILPSFRLDRIVDKMRTFVDKLSVQDSIRYLL